FLAELSSLFIVSYLGRLAIAPRRADKPFDRSVSQNQNEPCRLRGFSHSPSTRTWISRDGTNVSYRYYAKALRASLVASVRFPCPGRPFDATSHRSGAKRQEIDQGSAQGRGENRQGRVQERRRCALAPSARNRQADRASMAGEQYHAVGAVQRLRV